MQNSPHGGQARSLPPAAQQQPQRYGYIQQQPTMAAIPPQAQRTYVAQPQRSQQQQQSQRAPAPPPLQDTHEVASAYRYEDDDPFNSADPASPSHDYQRQASPPGGAPNEFEQPYDGEQQQQDAEGGAGSPRASEGALVYEDDGGAAYASRKYLYCTYALSAWGDRMWEFAAIVFIISLYPTSLFYSALFGLVENLVGILFGPYIGSLIDRWDRLVAMRWAIVGQNLSIALAGLVFWAALHGMHSETNSASGKVVTHAPKWLGLAYFFLLCMGGTAKVASTAAKLALHKDWVPVLAAGNAERLTSLNSSMRRIDLTASILAPLFVGLVSWGASEQAAVAAIAFWSIASLGVEVWMVGVVYGRIEALQHKEKAIEAAAQRKRDAEAARLEAAQRTGAVTLEAVGDRVAQGTWSLAERAQQFLQRFWASMRAYRAHPVFRASVAYALLYVSVLNLGGTMTSWLKLRRVSDAILAVVRGIAALVGVGATYATPSMIHRWGLLRAGVVAGWSQVLCLLPVVFAFVYNFSSYTTEVAVILSFLCASRFGLWAFDLVETQLMQHAVAPTDVGVVNGAQESAMNLCYIFSFLLTMIFPNPAWFAAPAWISFASVLVSAMMYTNYVDDATKGQGGAFPPLESFALHKEYAHQDEEAKQQQQDGVSAADVEASYQEQNSWDQQQSHQDQSRHRGDSYGSTDVDPWRAHGGNHDEAASYRYEQQ